MESGKNLGSRGFSVYRISLPSSFKGMVAFSPSSSCKSSCIHSMVSTKSSVGMAILLPVWIAASTVAWSVWGTLPIAASIRRPVRTTKGMSTPMEQCFTQRPHIVQAPNRESTISVMVSSSSSRA